MKKQIDTDILIENLNRNLALTEIEAKLTKISYGLLDDELYSDADAVNDLLEVLSLIELERQVIIKRIKPGAI